MRPHNFFFASVVFFLTGILLASIGWKSGTLILFAVIFTILLTTLLLTRKKPIAVALALTPLLLAGAVFYTHHHQAFIQSHIIPIGKSTTVTGIVANNPQRKKLQEFKLNLKDPYNGTILVKSAPYPEFAYGDTIQLTGSITKAKGGYATYLMKEGVGGIVTYPSVTLVKHGTPSIRGALFSIKRRVLEAFERTLPYQESAFLGGILLGAREEFSQDFKDAMSQSGTTHLVALSGYNIIIIINAALAVFTCIFSRRTTLALTILLILGFVVMTGGDASVVRAAVMAVIATLAPLMGRLYAPRNSIALAALVMTLENPNVLAYDVGFQLSFLALLGIIYVKPALQTLLKIGKDKGFLAWKENLLMTLAAQITVTPLLIVVFGSFTLTALVANVIILEAIPVTMFFGALTAAASFISYTLSLGLAWLTLFLLKFEIATIFLFSKIALPIRINLGVWSIGLYYIAIAGLLYVTRRGAPWNAPTK